jgi:hypothetical protein
MAVLTDEQKKDWDSIVGKPFNLVLPPQRQ